MTVLGEFPPEALVEPTLGRRVTAVDIDCVDGGALQSAIGASHGLLTDPTCRSVRLHLATPADSDFLAELDALRASGDRFTYDVDKDAMRGRGAVPASPGPWADAHPADWPRTHMPPPRRPGSRPGR